MNTADRSIALIDAALRRRFHFVPFLPEDGMISGLLGRWLDAHGGLDRPSFAMPQCVRSVAQRRLQRRLGAADQSTLTTVDEWHRRLIGCRNAGVPRSLHAAEVRHHLAARGSSSASYVFVAFHRSSAL